MGKYYNLPRWHMVPPGHPWLPYGVDEGVDVKATGVTGGFKKRFSPFNKQ